MMRHHIAATPSTTTPTTPVTPMLDPAKRGKKRGGYICGRCGLPKKGHVCSGVGPATIADNVPSTPRVLPPRTQRVLSFDDVDVVDSSEIEGGGKFEELGKGDDGSFDPDKIVSGGLPAGYMWAVMKRLPPSSVMLASGVCKGWRDVANQIWKNTEELRVRVPVVGSVGFVGSVLKKCSSSLVRISLRMESDVDSTMLACIAFSCPNLESIEILTSGLSVNRITGDELGRFVADKRSLTSFKMDGCINLGSVVISSSSLSTLWLSDLHSLSKTIFNCPNMKEVSLNFSHQENDTTDITNMMDNLGKFCPKLQNIHVASTKLSHDTVLALSAANLRGLRMLSLVLGSGITDASVAAIVYSFSKLELLDLSGSSITDNGIGIICNTFSRTLSRLLLALCPNITSSGIQFATAQLPILELMDCGMSICDPEMDDICADESNDSKKNSKAHHVYQKLIIKHNRLTKLSLWGCSGLDALYLNCPELKDLNLTSCRNLHPERLLFQCPNLESIHATGCVDSLCEVIETQMDSAPLESHLLSKRMADGSKRVRVPHIIGQQPSEDSKQLEVRKRRCIVFTE
ncbi:F-box/LRR-repeat protein 17 [Amaranthus tricolor]|uniref:F-box/LRR-repeat protein 17 n=1 Tax=Amaranthus tricolor TaxID=29722 RepID=UPI002582EC79|nr:F-box/LRR-repeat protein 17 [Amaranthus tricolor]